MAGHDPRGGGGVKREVFKSFYRTSVVEYLRTPKDPTRDTSKLISDITLKGGRDMVGIDRESGFVVGDVFLAMASLKERAGDEVDVDVIDGVDGVEAKRVERDRGGETERSSRRSRVSRVSTGRGSRGSRGSKGRKCRVVPSGRRGAQGGIARGARARQVQGGWRRNGDGGTALGNTEIERGATRQALHRKMRHSRPCSPKANAPAPRAPKRETRLKPPGP